MNRAPRAILNRTQHVTLISRVAVPAWTASQPVPRTIVPSVEAHVRPSAATQNISSACSGDSLIRASLAEQPVRTASAEDPVAPSLTKHQIGPGTSHHVVVAPARIDNVIASASQDDVVPLAGADDVVSRRPPHRFGIVRPYDRARRAT